MGRCSTSMNNLAALARLYTAEVHLEAPPSHTHHPVVHQ